MEPNKLQEFLIKYYHKTLLKLSFNNYQINNL